MVSVAAITFRETASYPGYIPTKSFRKLAHCVEKRTGSGGMGLLTASEKSSEA